MSIVIHSIVGDKEVNIGRVTGVTKLVGGGGGMMMIRLLSVREGVVWLYPITREGVLMDPRFTFTTPQGAGVANLKIILNLTWLTLKGVI